MTAELVAFPSVWKTASAWVNKGSLVLVKAKVQQADETFKLLADDMAPLDAPDLKAQASRWRRPSPARSTPQPATQRSIQRAYIRIGEAHESPSRLNRLKQLLSRHRGDMQTVLFYERGRRTVALSDDYRIQPSPALSEAIVELLGEGAFRIK